MRIAIVGGGAAGTLLALALLARSSRPDAITLFDRHAAFGRGLAYSAPAPHHRINVPAAKMGGAPPSDDAGFVDWLRAQGLAPATFADAFVPRWWFGDYLLTELDAACARHHGVVRRLHAEATSLERMATGGWVVHGTASDVRADVVVLCTGNPPPQAPWPDAGPRLVADAWAAGALDGVNADHRVVLLGSGATAVDVALELWQRGHRMPLVMLSRRALLPLVDAPASDTLEMAVDSRLTLRQATRCLREALASAPHLPWQTVFDAFRANAAALWQNASDVDRRRFLRHVRALWMVHRHRLAPDVATRLASARATGDLVMQSGRIESIDGDAEGCSVAFRAPCGHAGDAPLRHLRADWIVNCIGPSEQLKHVASPLWQGLLAAGRVRAGPLGLGVDVDEALRAIDAAGRPWPDLRVVGLATRGRFWEVTAVPQLRQQANALAESLMQPANDPCPIHRDGIPSRPPLPRPLSQGNPT